MDVKAVVKKVEASPEFRKWKGSNKTAYLSSAFLMMGGNGNWLLSYYDLKSNLMTSFDVGDDIAVHENEEVFKQDRTAVKELDMGRVSISAEKALAVAKKSFPKDGKESFKTIVVLQNLDVGQVWNITFLLRSLSTVNFKIDAKTGKVLSQKTLSLFESKAG